MHKRHNAPHHAAQAHDLFAAMLDANDVLPLVAVFMCEALTFPPRPLGPPEGFIFGSNGALATRKSWSKSVHKRAEKYPGYQPGHTMRQQMKCDMPNENAPLSAFVFKRLDYARAVWSADLDAHRTRRQFDEWLPLYLNFQTFVAPLWPDGHQGPNDNWALSFQFLRLACELPRYPVWRSAA